MRGTRTPLVDAIPQVPAYCGTAIHTSAVLTCVTFHRGSALSLEIVLAPGRPVLLSCIALALSGGAAAAPNRPYMQNVHVGGRRDDAAALEPRADVASTRLHSSQVTSISNCADSGPASAARGPTSARSNFKLPPATYTIGRTIAGLAGSGLVLQQSGADNLPFTRNGSANAAMRTWARRRPSVCCAERSSVVLRGRTIARTPRNIVRKNWPGPR